MPEFHRPRYVYVEPGGPNLDAILAVLIVALVVAGVVWFVEAFAVVILAVEAALTVALTAYLVHRLRADGPMWRPAGPVQVTTGLQETRRAIRHTEAPAAVQGRTAPPWSTRVLAVEVVRDAEKEILPIDVSRHVKSSECITRHNGARPPARLAAQAVESTRGSLIR